MRQSNQRHTAAPTLTLCAGITLRRRTYARPADTAMSNTAGGGAISNQPAAIVDLTSTTESSPSGHAPSAAYDAAWRVVDALATNGRATNGAGGAAAGSAMDDDDDDDEEEDEAGLAEALAASLLPPTATIILGTRLTGQSDEDEDAISTDGDSAQTPEPSSHAWWRPQRSRTQVDRLTTPAAPPTPTKRKRHEVSHTPRHLTAAGRRRLLEAAATDASSTTIDEGDEAEEEPEPELELEPEPEPSPAELAHMQREREWDQYARVRLQIINEKRARRKVTYTRSPRRKKKGV